MQYGGLQADSCSAHRQCLGVFTTLFDPAGWMETYLHVRIRTTHPKKGAVALSSLFRAFPMTESFDGVDDSLRTK
eukprot:3376369-Amphidinium_carterae.3